MSTGPSGWTNPKTNWTGADIPIATDFNRIECNASATELGNRTVDQAQVPSSHDGTLRQFLSWIVNRIKAITGATNWYSAPATTLAAAKTHMDGTAAHGATGAVVGTTNTQTLENKTLKKSKLDTIGVAAEGGVRWNSTSKQIEVYDGTSWVEVGGGLDEATVAAYAVIF